MASLYGRLKHIVIPAKAGIHTLKKMKTTFPSFIQYPKEFEEIKNAICENIAVLDIANVKNIFTIFVNYHVEEKIVDFELLKRFIGEILSCIDIIISFKIPLNKSFMELKAQSFKDVEHIKTKDSLKKFINEKLETIKHKVNSGQTDINYTRASKFLCYMIHQYKGNEKLQEIVRKTTDNITYDHFRKTFKNLTNVKISSFYRTVHMDKATELLLSTPMTVKEISYTLGYEYETSFIEAFKQHFHTTPNSFRQNPPNYPPSKGG